MLGDGRLNVNGIAGRSPLREALTETSGRDAMPAQPLDRLVSEYAVGATTVGYDFSISSQVGQSLLQVLNLN